MPPPSFTSPSSSALSDGACLSATRKKSPDAFARRLAGHRVYRRGADRPRCRSCSPLSHCEKNRSRARARKLPCTSLSVCSMPAPWPLIFSIAMIWVPGDQILNATAHSGPLAQLASQHHLIALFMARYGGLCLRCSERFSSSPFDLRAKRSPHIFERVFGMVSKNLGQAVGGQDSRSFTPASTPCAPSAISPPSPALSLGMWLLIALAYFETCRAFPPSAACRNHSSQMRAADGRQRRRQHHSASGPRLVLADRPGRRRHLGNSRRERRSRHCLRRHAACGHISGHRSGWPDLGAVRAREPAQSRP